jgi:hypothetical protein
MKNLFIRRSDNAIWIALQSTLLFVILPFSQSATVFSFELNATKYTPQHVKLLSEEPVQVRKTVGIVFPSASLNMDEAVLSSELSMRLPRKRLGTGTEATVDSNYKIYIGMPERLPELDYFADSLTKADNTYFTRDEEYALLVTDTGTIITSKDWRGLHWGLLMWLDLITTDSLGFSLPHVFIHDWPDFPKRICTINSPVRTDEQFAFVDSLCDAAYESRMSEIAWNNPDLGSRLPDSDKQRRRERMIANKIKRRHMIFSAGVDRTGARVDEWWWQEGIPVKNMRMVVTDSGFAVMNKAPDINDDSLYEDSWQRQISLTAFAAYTLRFRLRTEKEDSPLLILIEGGGAHSRLDKVIIHPQPYQDWTDYSTRFSTFQWDNAKLYFQSNEYIPGGAWIKDVYLETAPPENMLRRDDTYVNVYHEPEHILLSENVDYHVIETDKISHEKFIKHPKFEAIQGGRLTTGDTVSVDWFTAVIYQGKRETECFSLDAPLEDFADKISGLRQMFEPDGYNLLINEVAYAGYDPLCTSRNLSPGELAGNYVQRQYEIIQAADSGAPVRIYGDPFDVWVHDARAHRVSKANWNDGAMECISPDIELMMLMDYSTNPDSSLAFYSRHGHPSVVAMLGTAARDQIDQAISLAKTHQANGLQIYDWEAEGYERLNELGAAMWHHEP